MGSIVEMELLVPHAKSVTFEICFGACFMHDQWSTVQYEILCPKPPYGQSSNRQNKCRNKVATN